MFPCLQKMRTVGNSKARHHWEAKVPIYWPRPTPNARMWVLHDLHVFLYVYAWVFTHGVADTVVATSTQM